MPIHLEFMIESVQVQVTLMYLFANVVDLRLNGVPNVNLRIALDHDNESSLNCCQTITDSRLLIAGFWSLP